MVNSIQSIEPMYEGKNTPPRPKEKKEYTLNDSIGNYEYTVTNKEELELWDKMYGKLEE